MIPERGPKLWRVAQVEFPISPGTSSAQIPIKWPASARVTAMRVQAQGGAEVDAAALSFTMTDGHGWHFTTDGYQPQARLCSTLGSPQSRFHMMNDRPVENLDTWTLQFFVSDLLTYPLTPVVEFLYRVNE